MDSESVYPSSVCPAANNGMQVPVLNNPETPDVSKCAPCMVLLLDGQWLLATDPENAGRIQKWWRKPVPEARPAKVPWVIQETFHEYHGVAWYWRSFDVPSNPHPGGRYLLRFLAVSYLADVWVNGIHVGAHEGDDTSFVLDITDAVKPLKSNSIAVRVLNPTYEPIDGMTLTDVALSAKGYPIKTDTFYNAGGIVDSVELLVAAALRVQDIYVLPNAKTGIIHIEATMRNSSSETKPAGVQFTVAPAVGGASTDCMSLHANLSPGDTVLKTDLTVENPILWGPDNPYLYRVTVRAWQQATPSFDETSTRCGFREFRFENDSFRLNGKRLLLKGVTSDGNYPISFILPYDADVDSFRRLVMITKTMGFNIVRLGFGRSTKRQHDICDELGLLICKDSQASLMRVADGWADPDKAPVLKRRFDRASEELIRSARNNPSIVMWGRLNETHDSPIFRHVVETLPLVRSLDMDRVVMLNSGRLDNDWTIGCLSNPGSMEWESPLLDLHSYPQVPLTSDYHSNFRLMGNVEHENAIREYCYGIKDPPANSVDANGNVPIFLTEFGTGGAPDILSYLRNYEQRGAEHTDDARYLQDLMHSFMADWKRLHLEQCWPYPRDFFLESNRIAAVLRVAAGNTLRANPNLTGFFLSGLLDNYCSGTGLITPFRDPKEYMTDIMLDLNSSVRLCLFAAPVNIYAGGTVKLEAMLLNEDILRPGDYPVRLQVVGSDNTKLLDETATVTVTDPNTAAEQPFVLPVFSRDLRIAGREGKCRFLATLKKGAAASGGETYFHVTDPDLMPPVETDVVLWGQDRELAAWLKRSGIRTMPFVPLDQAAREVILVGNAPPDSVERREAFSTLVSHIVRGSTAIFLSPDVFAEHDELGAWLPLEKKGNLARISYIGGYYRSDVFAKRHPVFDMLPSGGMLDYNFYQNIIPQVAWCDLDTPAESVVGSIRLQAGYLSGSMLSVYELGAGRFMLNTLLLREGLGKDPVAERLLRNMLRYATPGTGKLPADLPSDFESQLRAIKYK